MISRGKQRIATALVVALLATVPVVAPAGVASAATVGASVATPSVSLRSVAMLDASTAVAVASNGTIWRSVSAGNDWTQVRAADAYDLRAVDFWDANTGLAVDLAGKVAHTTDGGVTWSNVNFSPYADMDGDGAPKTHYALACIPGTTGNAVSLGGDTDFLDDSQTPAAILRTTGSLAFWWWASPFLAKPRWVDTSGLGDFNWVGEGEFLDVSFASGTHGWAVGQDLFFPTSPIPLVYRTTDGGGDWTRLTSFSAPASLTAVAFGTTSVGIVAGTLFADNAPRVYRTTDGGDTWTQGTLPAGVGTPRALHMTSATAGWLAGDGGTLLRTTDGGATWTACTKPAGFSAHLYDVKLVGTTGIAVGESAVLMTDDGVTWYRPDATPPALSAIASTSHPVAATWYSAREAAASWTASDSSGIAGYAVAIDQDPVTVPGPAITQTANATSTVLPADGVWYVHVRAVDTRGNWSGVQRRALRTDTAPPETGHDAVASYAGSATITLSPTDPAPGSGVAATYWAIDGGASGTGTSVTVSTEGDFTLRFASADNAGNREASRTVGFAVEIAPDAPEISSATHPDADQWYGAATLEASWTAEDSSGIAGYAVVFDQAADTVPAPTVTQTGATFSQSVADGEWYLHVRALDTRGNWGPVAHRRFLQDVALPVLSPIASSSHPNAAAWYPSRSVVASWTASDPSGIEGYSVVIDQNAGTRPPETVSTTENTTSTVLPADGVWYMHVIAVDGQGDWSGVQRRALRADTAPPETGHDAVASYAGSASITLSPTDPAPGSGVAATYWAIDGGASGTGTSVTVSTEGDFTLRFASTDNVGNREASRTVGFAVEIAPGAPVISSATHPDADQWYGGAALEASWTAEDSSGIAGYAVVLDQAADTVPAAEVTQTGATFSQSVADGEWYLHVRAVDTRGNWGPVTHRRFMQDATPPQTTSNAVASYAGSASITLSPTDPAPGSGVAATYWAIDGGASGTGTSVTVGTEGDFTLRFYSVDNAGNREPDRVAAFAVEIAPRVPVISSATHPVPGTAYADGAFTASWTVPDADVVGYGVVLDSSPGTVPQAVTQAAATFEAAVPAGATRYLHVRPRDARGNWGPAAHFAVTVAPVAATAVAGDDRIATAIAAAKVAFPTGAPTVVIATARNWPDALGGAALAGAVGGPILLTEPGALPAAVSAAIRDLGAGRAIILGGTAAVSAEVQSALEAQLGKAGVSRIAGADRYATARAVAAETVKRANASGSFSGTAFVATGANFPDALGASPLAAANGWPIYLVRPTGVDGELVAAMKAAGVTRVMILGGEAAVSTAAETVLRKQVPGSYRRLAGADRYDTARVVATFGVTDGGLAWDKVALATGVDFPDALAGGVLQGRAGSVMLLTRPDALYEGARQTLVANKGVIWEIRFLGGTGAVSQTVRAAALTALK